MLDTLYKESQQQVESLYNALDIQDALYEKQYQETLVVEGQKQQQQHQLDALGKQLEMANEQNQQLRRSNKWLKVGLGGGFTLGLGGAIYAIIKLL